MNKRWFALVVRSFWAGVFLFAAAVIAFAGRRPIPVLILADVQNLPEVFYEVEPEKRHPDMAVLDDRFKQAVGAYMDREALFIKGMSEAFGRHEDFRVEARSAKEGYLAGAATDDGAHQDFTRIKKEGWVYVMVIKDFFCGLSSWTKPGTLRPLCMTGISIYDARREVKVYKTRFSAATHDAYEPVEAVDDVCRFHREYPALVQRNCDGYSTWLGRYGILREMVSPEGIPVEKYLACENRGRTDNAEQGSP